MAENKTKPTTRDVDGYLAAKANAEQLTDCKALMVICTRVTGQSPRMWGPSIVGFGSYTYTYPSGHSGEACLVGFAIRGKELVLYLMDSPAQTELLTRLGKYRMGKSCLYIKRLTDVDASVLEALIAESVFEIKRRHGG